MSEKDTLMQIEADLQSGKDVVEWTWQRHIPEAEKQKRLKFLKYGFHFSNLTIPLMGWFMGIAKFSDAEDEPFRYGFYAVIAAYTLLNYWVLTPFALKRAAQRQYDEIKVKIRFSKQQVQVNEQSYRFHKHSEAVPIFGVLDNKQPEILAQLQRVQTLLHEKTGLHFE